MASWRGLGTSFSFPEPKLPAVCPTWCRLEILGLRSVDGTQAGLRSDPHSLSDSGLRQESFFDDTLYGVEQHFADLAIETSQIQASSLNGAAEQITDLRNTLRVTRID